MKDIVKPDRNQVESADWPDDEMCEFSKAHMLFKEVQEEVGFVKTVNIWLNILSGAEMVGQPLILSAMLRYMEHMTYLIEHGQDIETIDHH